MQQVAAALNMKFVYGFIPKEMTLEKMVEAQARELAKQIVGRTSTNMELEDQQNSRKRLERAIEERTEILKNEMPRILWD